MQQWHSEGTAQMAGSELLVVEVLRAARRVSKRAAADAQTVLDHVLLVPLTSALLADAAELDPPLLSSLDAIHLVSALSIRDELSAFVVYDRRLAEAATTAGLTVVAPGT